MAGHSKWANTKRRKASQDAQKNKERTRLIKAIIAAIKKGGTTQNNPYLEVALQQAAKGNVPKNKREEAIKRASGLQADNYEELALEAYAPYGVALLIETTTNNHRRTVAAVRSILNKYGGKLATNNLFARKGLFYISLDQVADQDHLTLLLLEAGIDSLEEYEDQLYLTCPLTAFHKVKEALTEATISPEEISLAYIPSASVDLSPEQTVRLEKLIDALEEEDDVQNVYHNISFNPDPV